MSHIRSKDMKPELLVRKLVHSMGYRYRLHQRQLPGQPDLVFGPKRKVIFVHGCFWHMHPDSNCIDSRMPKSNREYWIPKLKRNVKRDSQHIEALIASGWQVLVIWECETKDMSLLKKIVFNFLEK